MINRIGKAFDFRMSPEEHKKIKKISMKRCVSMADIVREAIDKYLKLI